MRKLSLLLTALLMVSNTEATPVYHPSGPNLTYGAISNGQTIMSDITNPAAGASIFTQDTGQFRFGVLSSIGGGYEIGDVTNFVTELDNTIDSFTNGIAEQGLLDINSQLANPGSFPDATAYADAVLVAANQVITDINNLMDVIEQDGSFTGFFSGHLPLMPFVIKSKSLTGSFVIDVNGSFVSQSTFLSDAQDALTQADIIAQATNTFNTGAPLLLGDLLSSDSSVVVKGAVVGELSLGYSTDLMRIAGGDLFMGVRGNFYQVGLTRSAHRIDAAANQTLNDIFEQNNDQNLQKSSGFGVDLGMLWVSDHYRAGATLKNVNKPSFDYNPIDTSGYTDARLISILQAGDTYEMKPQLKLEGALFTKSQNWVLGVGLDANPVDDPVGREFQWATLSAAYATDSWIIPGLRMGYRSNLAGSKLSYASLGFTLFKSMNLDIAYGLDKVTIESNDLTSASGTIPRSMIINLGLELTF